MLVNRLYLRNYRVFADELELELPPGLVGIYGPNGAGKSTLVESVRFTLFGRSRTANDEIRTAGVGSECVTEIGLEHEGHQYTVRRTISGSNSTMKAEAHADGAQVAEGVRDTSRYVQSILGMDDTAFRASVFAEQKQLSAFSEQAPNERRRLVLQLLGITPLDVARDLARKHSRQTQTRYEDLRRILPDLQLVENDLAAAQEAAAAAATAAATAEASAVAAREGAAEAVARYEELDRRRQEYERLVAAGRAARANQDRAQGAVEKLAAEVAELERSAARLGELAADAEGWREAEATLRQVETVVAAALALAGLAPEAADPPAPDEEGMEAARSAAEAARSELATVAARLESARSDLARAEEAGTRSAELSPGADCPLCGQALGDAFESVRAHREADVGEARSRVMSLEKDHVLAVAAAGTATTVAAEATRAAKRARELWAGAEQARGRRAELARALSAAEAVLGRPVADGEAAALAAEVERRRKAADESQVIRGRLARREAAVAELDVERAAMAEASARRDDLRRQVDELDYRSEQLDLLRAGRDEALRSAESAGASARLAQVAAVTASTQAEAAARRLDDARDQHRKLAEMADEARHLARLADLMNAFRNSLVATVGPRLSAQAAELFAELTDHEYDDLAVDQDTYEIKVRDAGLLYGMNRFSGSETDLANLALRVAVSEQVRFQSGGAVGLLVLDEVFGPLDDDRKERMLLALQRLNARFRQVMVVTHDAAVKEQLPSAVEVVKLPGRRATARLLNA